NRLLTFLLVIIAVLTVLAVWRSRRRHPELLLLAGAIGGGIVVQAVVGGITVRTRLNPWVVRIHFVCSAMVVAVAAVLVGRSRRASLVTVAAAERPGRVAGVERSWVRALAPVLAVSSARAICLGTLVTGTGPHSGDGGVVARLTFH